MLNNARNCSPVNHASAESSFQTLAGASGQSVLIRGAGGIRIARTAFCADCLESADGGALEEFRFPGGDGDGGGDGIVGRAVARPTVIGWALLVIGWGESRTGEDQ